MPAMRSDRKKVLERAIIAAGGLDGLATPLGISKQAVSQWNEVPSTRVLDVERLSGVSRCELRPDLYPPGEYGKRRTVAMNASR